VLKNYNKDGQKLPLFGIGPYMIFGMGLVTLIGIILFGYVFKIGILETPWIMVFRITGAALIVSGIFIWFTGAVPNGIYAWVRNPMYSGWWIAFAGITIMWHNIWMFVLPVINWIIMTIILINSEEKWLSDLYGAEYETYKTKVNRCIPWKPCEDRIYVTEIADLKKEDSAVFICSDIDQ
jgi:protein-S-isoprenylcysteine O-methyltransferase Ste14